MVAPGRYAPGHLGELTQQIPFELVDAALAETGRTQARIRELPARVVVYLLLAGCLFTELGYVQVWQRLCAGLDGLPLATPTASALTQARRRLGPAPLRALFDLLGGPAPVAATSGVRVGGLLVCAIDGTTMSVADTPPTMTSTPPSLATTAARAIPCCAWSPWSPAAPAACWLRPSARPAAARPP
jgi:Insertion element 4 transposase N-terminal